MERFWELWDGLCFEGKPTLLHGDSRGVDRAVAAAVRRRGFAVSPFPADWDRYGKAAGPLRNEQMLKQADHLIAFIGGRGTEHCVRTAEKMGKSVYLVRLQTDPLGAPPVAASRGRHR